MTARKDKKKKNKRSERKKERDSDKEMERQRCEWWFFTYFIDRINMCTGDIVIRGECIITIMYVVADERPRWAEAGSRISAAAPSEATTSLYVYIYIYHAAVVQPDML